MNPTYEDPTFLYHYGEKYEKLKDYDFVKKLEVIRPRSNHFFSITENQYINSLEIANNENGKYITKTASKRFGTYLYDIASIANNSLIVEGQEPPKAYFAVSAKDSPIHLYEFRPGNNQNPFKSLCAFNLIKPNSEIYISAIELKYNPQHNALFVGGKNTFCAFDMSTLSSYYKSKSIGKKEIISCFAFPEDNSSNIVALGNYDKVIKLLSLQDDMVIGELKGHMGGLTCLKFSPNNKNLLFSGARKDALVYCWDIRNTATFVTYYERKTFTNQRIGFEISNSDILYLGNEDGTIVAYDVKNNTVKSYFQADADIITDIHICNLEDDPTTYMLTASGDRKFVLADTDSFADDIEDDKTDNGDNLYLKDADRSKWYCNKIQFWKLNEPFIAPIHEEPKTDQGQGEQGSEMIQQQPEENNQINAEVPADPQQEMNIEPNQ